MLSILPGVRRCCLVKVETDEHLFLSVAAVDVRCQLQHRSFKQNKLVGHACDRTVDQPVQQLLHFGILDVKGCSSRGTAAVERVTVKS